jgi:DNA-binding NarL/FixJ family response regulator
MESIAAKNVFVVEDSAPVRSRLVEMLNDIENVHIVGEAEIMEHAVAGILRTLPDYVVLDFQLKSGTRAQVLPPCGRVFRQEQRDWQGQGNDRKQHADAQ